MITTPVIRAFKWSDLNSLVELLSDIWSIETPDHPVNLSSLKQYLKDGISSGNRKCVLVSNKDRNVGYLFMNHEKPISRLILEGGIHSAYRGQGLGKLLISHGLEEARSMGAQTINIPAPKQTAYLTSLLSSAGLKHVRTHWHMIRPNTSITVPKMPKTLQLQYFSKGQEEAFATLQNNCFKGEWGFSPNTKTQISTSLQYPGNYDNGILLLTEKNRFIGYNWTLLISNAMSLEGVISMTGVLPEYRGRGLGKLVVTSGIDQLQNNGVHATRLTVDADNTPARELYLKLGFQKLRQTLWYGNSI